jgi:L-alanine-DL-glutamate epimerase-like enolase superfamily enzyme
MWNAARGLADQVKIEQYNRQGIACAEEVHKTIGNQRDLLVDVRSRFDLQHGLDLLRRFEPLRLFWLEEETASDADQPAIKKAANMPSPARRMSLPLFQCSTNSPICGVMSREHHCYAH